MRFLKNKVRERAIRMGKYHEIIGLLSHEFDWDDIVEQACMKSFVSNDEKFDQSYEFIVDHPATAQFRLKWSEDGFRLSYYPPHFHNEEAGTRALRITQQIRRIENA